MMNGFAIAFIAVLSCGVISDAGELPGQDGLAKAAPQADGLSTPKDVNNPGNTLPTEQQPTTQQSADFKKKAERPVSAHKVNYFSLHGWPGNENAQLKYQISMKFRVLEPNLYVLKYSIFPAYFAYTQMSLWNVSQQSGPVEESNYNPEFFLDYPVNAAIIGRLRLRNIVISPLEHESNGLAGDQSRSWNRQYVLVRFGFESKEKLEVTNSFLSDQASMYVKLWNASGYSDQDAYLRALGRSGTFLDYRGRGEIGASVRNFLWGGSLRDHQLDIRTPIFRDERKHSYQFEFRQQLPTMNFALYLQYWYGYGETLLRFDQFGHRGFAGLSFSY
ncbi:MAG: phospholipase A [Nitrospirota bacterium]